MGNVGAAIAGPLIGAATSSIFGKKDKSPSAAAAANSAPVQTEGQKWADENFRNVMDGWMTNSPKINVPKPTQTKITYGTQQPAQQQTQFFGSGGNNQAFNGPRLPNVYPGMENPSVGAPAPASQSQPTNQSAFGSGGFSYASGNWQDNAANQGIQAQIDALKKQQQDAINSAASLGTRESLQAQLDRLVQQSQNQGFTTAQLQQLQQMGAYNPSQLSAMAGARGAPIITPIDAQSPARQNKPGQQTTQTAATNAQYQSQIKDIEAKLAQLNQYEGQATNFNSQIENLEKQLGPDQIYQAGELNIPSAPTSQPTLGTVGTYQPIFSDPAAGYMGMDYSGFINSIMSPVNMASASGVNPFGTFEDLNYSSIRNNLLQPLNNESVANNPLGSFQNRDYSAWISGLASPFATESASQNPLGSFQNRDYSAWINGLASPFATESASQNPLGSFQNRDYSAWINGLASPFATESASQNPLGSFQNRDYSAWIDGLASPFATESASQNPYGDYRANGYEDQIANITGYQNSLRQSAADQAQDNLSRTFREGYDDSYLKDLAASQIDPLKEMFGEAIKQATADFNRRGLSGSGFESLDKYGSNQDSITARFLKEASNVSRDVALRGAEAAREDQYRNASMQDQAISLANQIGAGISADQLQRSQAGLSASMQQDQMNEANRQYWDQNQLNKNQIDYGREMDSRNLSQAAMNAQMQQDQMNEANRQYWDQNQLNKNQIDYGREMDSRNLSQAAMNAQMQQDQMNEANRQYWDQNQLNKNQIDYSREMDSRNLSQAAMNAQMQQDQMNEANRQFWNQDWLSKNQVDFGRELNLRDLSQAAMGAQMQQDQMNEANRQYWSQDLLNRNQVDYSRDVDQKNFIQQWLNSQLSEDQTNEANRQFWSQDALNKNQIDYGRAMDQKDLIKTGLTAAMQQDSANEANRQRWVDYDRQLAQQNEGNRMSWANLLNNQQMYDHQQSVADWARNLDMMKWLVGREDDLVNRQMGAEMSQQEIDYGILKDYLNYMSSFANGQAPMANNMQQNYWQAYNAQNQQNAANQQYNQGLANSVSGMVSGMFQQQQPTYNQFANAGNAALGMMGVPIPVIGF